MLRRRLINLLRASAGILLGVTVALCASDEVRAEPPTGPLTVTPAPRAELTDSDELLVRAREARDGGDLDTAQSLYDTLLGAHPDLAWLMLECGQMFTTRSLYGRALPYCVRATEIDSLNVEALVTLGECQDGLGQNEDAIRTLRKALLLDPNHGRARFELGRLQYVTGDLEQAEATYRDLIARHKDSWKAYNNLGLVLLDRNEPTAALAALRKSLRLKPNDPGVLFNIGRALHARREYTAALRVFDQAIALWGPDDLAAVSLHHSRGNTLFALGRWQEAADAYRHAIRLDPEHWDSHLNLGAALSNLGRFDEAVAALEQAVAYRPDRTAVYRQMAVCYLETRQYDQALAALQRIHEQGEADAETWALAARIHDARGAHTDADVARMHACDLGDHRSCP